MWLYNWLQGVWKSAATSITYRLVHHRSSVRRVFQRQVYIFGIISSMFEHILNNIHTLTLNNELYFSVDVENYDRHQIYTKLLRNYNQSKNERSL